MTTVFGKPINNNICLNWNVFAPDILIIRTLKPLVKRIYIVCFTNKFLKQELKHLEKVLHEINKYPQYFIKQIIKQIQHKRNQQNVNFSAAEIVDKMKTNGKKKHLLLVSYQGKNEKCVIKSMKKRMKSLLRTN